METYHVIKIVSKHVFVWLPRSPRKSPRKLKKQVMKKKKTFPLWTDDESELLLNVTSDYM